MPSKVRILPGPPTFLPMQHRTLRLIGMLTVVGISTSALPSAFSFFSDALTPHFDPVAFGLPITAHEVVSKRTEKAVTFEVSPRKFASVSTGDRLSEPSCDQATLSTLCQAVSLVRGIIPYAFATTAGPNSPGTAVADNSYGTMTWSNPSNIALSDNTYASASDTGIPTTTYYLKGTNFGFSIPTSATVDGVVVEIERKCSHNTGSDSCIDSRVKIVQGGTVQGTNNAVFSNWGTSDVYATYGSSSDVWGLTLTPTDINASDFGGAISVQVIHSGGPS